MHPITWPTAHRSVGDSLWNGSTSPPPLIFDSFRIRERTQRTGNEKFRTRRRATARGKGKGKVAPNQISAATAKATWTDTLA